MSEVFRFGDTPDERWSFPNTRGEKTSDQIHGARYGERPLFYVASCAEALDYLIYGCPTTEMAVAKLRTVRGAARAEPEGR